MSDTAVADAARSDVFAAVASPVRRAMLDALRVGPLAVHELAAGFDISRPAVSQHLRVLREAGLVEQHRSGREHSYHLNPAPLQGMQAWVAHYEHFWRERLRNLSDMLDHLDDSPWQVDHGQGHRGQGDRR